jgi:hypothetical protein
MLAIAAAINNAAEAERERMMREDLAREQERRRAVAAAAPTPPSWADALAEMCAAAAKMVAGLPTKEASPSLTPQRAAKATAAAEARLPFFRRSAPEAPRPRAMWK